MVEDGKFTVQSVETKPLTRNPPPPFTTSTLQQEAARKLAGTIPGPVGTAGVDSAVLTAR